MAWWERAEVGMPIVALYSGKAKNGNESLAEGTVYVIAKITTVKNAALNCVPTTLFLRGMGEDYNSNGVRLGWPANYFRPATSTDLPASIREALKTPAPKEKVNG